jgi:hypothetical protein
LAWFSGLSPDEMAKTSGFSATSPFLASSLAVFLGGLYKRVNVWEAFIDGAKAL